MADAFLSGKSKSKASKIGFDNSVAQLPDNPETVQAALEESAKLISSMSAGLNGQISAEIENRLRGDTENSVAIAKTNFLLQSAQIGGIHGLSPNMWVDDLIDNTGIATLTNAQFDAVNKCIKGSGASASKQGIVIMKPTVADILVPMRGFVSADAIVANAGKWLKTVQPYPNDLVFFAPLDEASGNPVAAVGGLTMTATGTTIVDGYHGKGRQFKGLTSENIQVNGKPIPLGKKSMRFKVKPLAAGATGAILSCGPYSTHWGNLIMLDGNLRLGWTGNRAVSINPNFELVSAQALTQGTFAEILLTWDGTTSANGVKMWIDGVLSAQTTAKVTESTASSTNLFFGIQNGDMAAPLNGLLDEIEIYNTVKTPADFNREASEVSAKFYLSRDGGVTYMQVTLDDLADLSGLPSGNSMVVKAILENDTDQIRGIAWGVK